jgi:chromosome segregation ATPase
MSNTTFNERRITELTEKNKQLTEELDKVKRDRNGRDNERARKEGEEKEALKRKILDLENKCKEKYDSIMQNEFEFQKERQKWTIEKNTYYEKLGAAEDMIAKQAKEITKINNEKEKLKNNRANAKTTSFISNMKTFYEPPKIEK